MRMRPVLWSVAIQASGSAATLATALIISSQMGLAAQGEFGLLRSWNDAFVALAVLGLPQGLLHLQYRAAVPIAALCAWVDRYVGVLFAIAAIVAGAAGALLVAGLDPLQLGPPTLRTIAVMAAAVPLAAAHLLWRSLTLRHVGVVPYAAVTAAPSLLVLVGMVLVYRWGGTGAFAWVLFIAAVLTAIASRRLAGRAAQRSESDDTACAGATGWSRRTLWSISFETGVQSVLTALSPALMLSTAGWLGASLTQIGVVSLGLHVYQLFGVAAAYVAPMVYDRAARAAQPPGSAQLISWLGERVGPRMWVASGVGAPLSLSLIWWLWPAGTDSRLLLSTMAAAGALSMVVRLLITLMLARGAFRPLTFQAVARVIASTVGTAFLMQWWPATVALPTTLVATELFLLAWLWRQIHDGEAERSVP